MSTANEQTSVRPQTSVDLFWCDTYEARTTKLSHRVLDYASDPAGVIYTSYTEVLAQVEEQCARRGWKQWSAHYTEYDEPLLDGRSPETMVRCIQVTI